IVRNGLGGEPVSVLLDGVKRFDIAVRLSDATRDSVEALRKIALRTATGALVPLSEVADVSVAEGYSFVRREQLQRYAVIQMDVRGRDVDGFVKEAEAAIKQQVTLPAGYWIEWGGAFENQQRALAKLALIVPITIFFIFVLLYTAFNSIKYAALDRKSTRLNSSHVKISYAVFCLKKKKKQQTRSITTTNTIP